MEVWRVVESAGTHGSNQARTVDGGGPGGWPRAMGFLRAARVAVFLLLVAALLWAAVGFVAYVVGSGLAPASFYAHFRSVLDGALLLLIALELLHLVGNPAPANVVQLLVVMITREMLLHQHSGVYDLFGVAAVAGLFAVRRYLLADGEEGRGNPS